MLTELDEMAFHFDPSSCFAPGIDMPDLASIAFVTASAYKLDPHTTLVLKHKS